MLHLQLTGAFKSGRLGCRVKRVCTPSLLVTQQLVAKAT
jgi:hypothetical protein